MRSDSLNSSSGSYGKGFEVEHIEKVLVSEDGSASSFTKEIEVADSGKTYMIDISTYTTTVQLPAVGAAIGCSYKFVLSNSSDDEGTKSFGLFTAATGEDIVGNVMLAGAVLEITGSTLEVDASAAAATHGDWLTVFSDGEYWYCDGSVVTGSALVQNAGHALAG